MMKVTLDHEGCIGCGLCTGVCPGVFTMTEEGVAAARDEIFPEQEAQVRQAADGKAEVVQTPISEEEKDGARLSAENCPVSVIEAEE